MSLLFTIAHVIAWLLSLRGIALPEGGSDALLDPMLPLPATFLTLLPELGLPTDDEAIIADAAAVFPSPGTAGVFVVFGAALVRRRR